MLGDFLQLAPCPPGGPLFTPPGEYDAAGSKQERARDVKNMLWGDDKDAVNYVIEMTEQKLIKDAWYARAMIAQSLATVGKASFPARTTVSYTASQRCTLARGRRVKASSAAGRSV
jgi:hypothetical protein